jgi:hypothetical protein
MSSGPGTLQRRILECVGDSTPIFYRQLLWKIALERDEIEKSTKLCSHLEFGTIKKSFKENFRRSVNSLEKSKRIEIEAHKLTEIEDAFRYFPYHTDRLEIYELRKFLLPVLREYILKENPHRFGNSKIEEKQLSEIKKDQKYIDIQNQWIDIEKRLISILYKESPLYNNWLQILVRGRCLFISDSIAYHKSFVTLYKSLLNSMSIEMHYEMETLILINELMNVAFDKEKWKLGEIKSIYYEISNMTKYRKEYLKDEVKDYLREAEKDFVTLLPDHKEPQRSTVGPRKIIFGHWGKVEYSKYMDMLITRQILRKQKIITLIP